MSGSTMKKAFVLSLGIGLSGFAALGGETLDRGAVTAALPDGTVYIGWRLLPSDPPDRAFALWRSEAGGEAKRLTPEPIVDSTNAVDRTAKPGRAYRYEIRILPGGETCATVEAGASREPGPAIRIPLGEGVRAQKVAIADLDGDGACDYVIKQPDFNVDPYENYWKKSEDTYKLEAYRPDGRKLWRHDMGWSIEEGIWYSPYVAYDLDGDGRAEVATKAGEGDPRDADGRVQAGPEWLLILDGATGKERTRIPWPDREGFESYNYYCRNILGVAYLDGKRPALIVVRGTYTLIKVRAYAFEGGSLRALWSWDGKDRYRGQGMHGLKAADVDGDGRDEVILGSAVLDDNGAPLWTTGLGHPDWAYVGDIDPARPGLEIAYGIERRQKQNGICLVEAKTGKILWGLDEPTAHVHGQGLAADIDPSSPGQEVYGGERDDPKKRWLFSAQGKLLATEDIGGLAPRAAWWGDAAHKSLIRGDGRIADYRSDRVLGRIRGRVVAIADILGDWREEIVTSEEGDLSIWTTAIPSARRRAPLMADRLYRLDVATASMGYYQPPELSGLPIP